MAASTTAAFGTNAYPNPNVTFLQQANHPQSVQLQHSLLNSSSLAALQQQQQVPQQQAPHQANQPKDTTFTKIFVGGLPYHTTDESLSQFFQKFGNIEEAVVINDRQTGKSRGYGFVTMESKEAAEAAVLDPNPVIDGRKANVNLAYLGVKSRIVAPSGIIPLAVRYQLPTTQSAYGFHPFYYHPGQNAAAHPTQYIAGTPNLLIPAQQNQNLITANPTQPTAGLFELHQMTALNSNRASPFENGLNTSNGFSMQFNTTNANHPSMNALISQTQPPGVNQSYFAPLPQQLNSVFQSQLHDRL